MSLIPRSRKCPTCAGELLIVKEDVITPVKVCSKCDAPNPELTLSSLGYYEVEGHDA